jgi:hypothetical protein
MFHSSFDIKLLRLQFATCSCALSRRCQTCRADVHFQLYQGPSEATKSVAAGNGYREWLGLDLQFFR